MNWTTMKRFGVLIGILAAVVTIVVGLTTIWGWFTAPTEKLAAEVEFFPFIPPPEANSSIRGVWRVAIKNKGKLEASSVSLKLPSAIQAKIEWEGSRIEVKDGLREIIDLENLKPEEIISVTAWASTQLSKADADKVRLNHKTGVGSIAITAPLGPPWQWLAEYWVLLIFGLIFGLLIISVTWEKKSKTTDTQQK